MGRKARNRNADAVLMFWMQLNASEKLECVLEMMRHLAGRYCTDDSIEEPKRSKRKESESQTAPIQVHSVPAG